MKITIDTSGMDEMQIEWLKNSLKEEIDDAYGTASNEHLVALGSDTNEDAYDHEHYADLHREYGKMLEDALSQLEKK